jgi:signal recognition particle subunit SRP54
LAFEGLTDKLQSAFKKLTSKGKLNEKDVKQAMREVKMALLEADVNFIVVKDLIKKISERAVGSEIMESLTPGQQVIKIVNEELTALMGGSYSKVFMASKPPTIVMLVGLQGSGKTTHAGKLANYFKKQGKNPLLTACDVYRPAAIKQLQVVGEKVKTPVFERGQKNPVQIAREALEYANEHHHDMVLIDTAGRLHINEELMDELKALKAEVKPHEILLVVDAMTGQDAVNVAQSFNEQLGIDGLILTKLDGDTRGGAALSARAVTGKPIKFAGIGEKLDDLEIFHPDRMANRILGMGDVLTIIEKAQSRIDLKKAQEMEKKLRTQSFTLDDYLEQLEQVKNMGSMQEILSMIPGMNAKKLGGIQLDEKQIPRTQAIIQSMTLKERTDPSILCAIVC